jgi:transposase-like protein
MNRKLSPVERTQLVEQYQSGKSTYELARQFGTDRHTIARHLRHEGIELRPQRKMTPQRIQRARQLHTAGSSLATIAKQLGVSPTTAGKPSCKSAFSYAIPTGPGGPERFWSNKKVQGPSERIPNRQGISGR